MNELRNLATIAAGGLIATAMSGAAQAGPLLDMTGGWSQMIAGPLTMAGFIALVLATVFLMTRRARDMRPVVARRRPLRRGE